MDPEILLGISLDNDLHLLIHLLCQTEDLRLLTLKGPGPEGVGDDPFEVVPVLRSAAGDDHDGPLIQHRENGGRRCGPGPPPEKVDCDPLPDALIGQQPDRLPLLKGLLKHEEGILLGNDDLAAIGALAVQESFKIGVAQGPGHDDQGDAHDGTHVGKKFPVADMGRDKDATPRFSLYKCPDYFSDWFQINRFIIILPNSESKFLLEIGIVLKFHLFAYTNAFIFCSCLFFSKYFFFVFSSISE